MRSYFRLALLVLCALSLSAQTPPPVVYYYAYGPFLVIDERTVALIGSTDLRSPAAFRAMMRDHPHVATLVFLNCPGTRDDAANLALGRLIRAAELDAYVPPGASVRSGAVDLLVAAERRRIDDGARFAVHAWRDWKGREATDFAPDAPVHRKYLIYYREMGMSGAQAAAFYAMTNSAPNRSARNVTAAEMRAWIGADAGAVPLIAYQTGP
jgi:hypothetical protein